MISPPTHFFEIRRGMGRKKKEVRICQECNKSKRPAINAARLGHENCLVIAYRVLGVLNQRDDYGATPIHYAARHGQVDCLNWLIDHSGISPNAVARNGATAAHDAAAMGHLDCLQYLLHNTQCSVSDATAEGATILHIACRFGQAQVTKWLLDSTTALPSEKGANNVTPVHICAAKSRSTVAPVSGIT